MEWLRATCRDWNLSKSSSLTVQFSQLRTILDYVEVLEETLANSSGVETVDILAEKMMATLITGKIGYKPGEFGDVAKLAYSAAESLINERNIRHRGKNEWVDG